MNRFIRRLAPSLLVILAAVTTGVLAQAPAGNVREPAPGVPMQVNVVISRSQGDRQISRLSYFMTGFIGNQASMRASTRVPMPQVSAAVDNKPAPPYIDLSTAMDATVSPDDGGRFRMTLTFVESSILDGLPAELRNVQSMALPGFRNFSYSSPIVLKNGETQQVVSSVDMVTGETITLNVTLTLRR